MWPLERLKDRLTLRLATVVLLRAQGPLTFGAQRWRDLHLRILQRPGRFVRTSCLRRRVADNDGGVLTLLRNGLRGGKLCRGSLRNLYILIRLCVPYVRLCGCPSLKLPEKDARLTFHFVYDRFGRCGIAHLIGCWLLFIGRSESLGVGRDRLVGTVWLNPRLAEKRRRDVRERRPDVRIEWCRSGH